MYCKESPVPSLFRPRSKPLLMVTRLAAALLLLALARPGHAQFGRGPMGGMEEPTINSKEIERYGEILKLSADQLESAKGMLEGFNTEFSTIRQEARAAFESMRDEARETGDNSVWRNAAKLMQGFQQKIDKAERQYFDDFKLLLNDDQAQRWPTVERARRREKSVPRGGLISGESVDLVRIVHDLKLFDADRQAAQALLDQYEADLDRALVERDKAYQEGMDQGMQLWMNQQMDKIEELFNKSRDAAAKVKDINKRYARQVVSVLPEGKQAEFEKEVKKATFPRVFRPSYVNRSFDAALGLGDLSEDQRAQVTELKASFEQQAGPLLDKIAASVEETEMKRTAMQMFGMGGPGGEGSQELRDQRRELESSTYDKLRAVLTESQREKIPEKPQQGNWRNMVPGMGGGGRGGEHPGRGT